MDAKIREQVEILYRERCQRTQAIDALRQIKRELGIPGETFTGPQVVEALKQRLAKA